MDFTSTQNPTDASCKISYAKRSTPITETARHATMGMYSKAQHVFWVLHKQQTSIAKLSTPKNNVLSVTVDILLTLLVYANNLTRLANKAIKKLERVFHATLDSIS
jgi:hypothetical protein